MKFWFGKEKADEGRVSAPKAEVPQVVPAAVPESLKPAAVAAVPEVKPVEKTIEKPVPVKEVPAEPGPQQQTSQRDLYCNLMNALYDAVLVLDDEGHVVDCNSRVEVLFGYDEDEMWDRPAKDIIKGFGPQLLKQIAEPLREHRPVIIDGSCVRRDGTVFAAEIAVGSVRLARGENIVISIRDVEKRMAAVMERLRSQGLVAARPSVVRLVSRKSDSSATGAPVQPPQS